MFSEGLFFFWKEQRSRRATYKRENPWHYSAEKCGMNMKVAQYIMGHSNISITMDRYTHIVNEDMVREEIGKLKQVT